MQEVVTLTEELIRFKTMHSHPQEIVRCSAFIEDYLNHHDIRFTRVEHGGYPSILILPDEAEVKVLLMAHIDVVDGGDDLFEPAVREGKLFGRGAIDDKYAAALCLVLVKAHLVRLRAQGKSQQDLPFGVLITSDEEIGGYLGVGKVVDTIRPEFCIALDGGLPDSIVVKEKGLLTLKMIARGRAAHGSRPWLGVNAVDNLIDDYAKLKTHFEKPVAGSWCRTLNLGIIKAGKSFNQVPDQAEAVFDIRFTEKDDPDQLFETLKAAVDSELSVMRTEPMFLGGSSPYLDRLRLLVPEAEVSFEHGASDARFFSQRGIPGIIWGADGESSAHAIDEHVTIDSIFKLYSLLDQFFSRPDCGCQNS